MVEKYVPVQKKNLAVPKRYISYVWYEILAVVLFVAAFVYVASLQFFAIEANVSLISCRSSRNTVATSIAEYRADFPNETVGFVRKEILLKKLYDAKYLRIKPKCWDGGIYKLNSKDEVYCTYHNPELEDAAN